MPLKAATLRDEIDEKWMERTARGKQARQNEAFIPNHRLSFVCKCPRCEKVHEAMIQWSGRGMPRVYCATCRTIIAAICDSAQATMGNGRLKNARKEDN